MSLYPITHAQAERSIVTACCAWPECFDDVDISPAAFASAKWRAAWKALSDLHLQSEPIDPVLVAERMRNDEFSIEPAELTKGIADIHPNAVVGYADVIRDAHVARQVLLSVSEVREAQKRGASGEQLLSLGLEKLAGISLEQPDAALSIGDILRERVAEFMEALEAKERGEEFVPGISTGLPGLDEKLGGLQRGVVTVVAGRPGMGKSAFAMSLVDGATKAGVGCHVFSLEDTRSAYADRAIARTSQIPVERLKSMDFTVGDLGNIQHRLPDLARREGWIVDDRGGLTADEIVRSVHRSAKKNQTGMVVIDYINLLKLPEFTRRSEALDEAMALFANAAKRDNLSYVVLSQLNRQCEAREDKRPLLSDLKDSGGIEEKAKCVLFLYRPCVYEDDAPRDKVEVLVRKNNQGATCVAMVQFDEQTIRMY